MTFTTLLGRKATFLYIYSGSVTNGLSISHLNFPVDKICARVCIYVSICISFPSPLTLLTLSGVGVRPVVYLWRHCGVPVVYLGMSLW